MRRCCLRDAMLLFYLLVEGLQSGGKEWGRWGRPGNGEQIEEAELNAWSFCKGLDMQEQGIIGIRSDYLIGTLLPKNVMAWLQSIWSGKAMCVFHTCSSFSFSQI